MSSRRVIRRHQPLISLRIPFDVQRLPPPPTITLRKNFQSTLRPSSNRIPLSRRPPFVVPMPVAGGSAKNSESRNGDHAAPVQCTPGGVRSKMADVDNDADKPESDLSDTENEEDLHEFHPHDKVLQSFTAKIPKPPGEAGRPGSGGFNLEETLGWPKEEFNKIQVSYKSLKIIQSLILCRSKHKIWLQRILTSPTATTSSHHTRLIGSVERYVLPWTF